MEQFKKIANRLLRPHWLVSALLSVIFGVGLVWLFVMGYDSRWFAYPIFVGSFYALVVDCVVLIPKTIALVGRWRTAAANREASEKEKQFKMGIYRKVLIDLVYGIVQIVQGVLQGSAWVGGYGIYHLGHAAARSILAWYERRLSRQSDDALRQKLAWRCYMVCGFALFGVNLTMTGLAFQMIWLGRSPKYSEIMVIAVAAFTFYKLIMAIIRVAACRRSNSPITGAVRNMALTEALMTLFSLQTALLTTFGQDYEQQFLMNSLTGFAVCLSTMLGGLGMILHGRKRMREITGEGRNGT